MKKSDKLFHLIKSLSRAERRSLRMVSSLQAGEKKYMRLFDIIDAQKVYDEAAIREAFAGDPFARQLHVAENYLYNLIMKRVREIAPLPSAQSRIFEILKDYVLLRDRGLTDQAMQHLRRAKELAIEYEYFAELLVIIQFEYRSTDFVRSPPVQIEALFEQEEEALHSLATVSRYHKAFMTLRNIPRLRFLEENGPDDRIESVFAELRTPEGARRWTFRGETFYHWANLAYYLPADNRAAALPHVRAMFENFEANPRWVAEMPAGYVSTANNLLTLLDRLGHGDEFLDVLSRARESLTLLEQQNGIKYLLAMSGYFNLSFTREVMFRAFRGEFEQCIGVVDRACAMIGEAGKNLRPGTIQVFHHIISYAYFGLGKYREALRFIHYVLDGEDSTRDFDVYCSAKIFALVIHYELGNFDLLESLIRSTYRFLHRRNNAHPCERAILQFFERLLRAPSDREVRAALVDLYDNLNELAGAVVEPDPLTYFDYIAWLESRLSGRPFREVLAERPRRLAHARG